MLKEFVILSLLCLFGTHARQFINPLIDGADHPDPGVIFYQGLYYAVTTTSNTEWEKFPIFVSTDLQSWNQVGFVFNQGNFPPWSNNEREFWAPEIHLIGENQFRVYFTSRDLANDELSIGVAASNNILGPYIPNPRPFDLGMRQGALDATIVQDNGQVHLIWKGPDWMYGRLLTPDGLDLLTGDFYLVMRNDLPWEAAVIEAPWIVKRGDTFYMFYSGNVFCGDVYAVGVARSNNPFGPYEKKGDPILASNDQWKGPGHCSVVQDVNGVDSVMVYHGYRAGEVCVGFPRLMLAQSVGWGPDGWPFMIPN